MLVVDKSENSLEYKKYLSYTRIPIAVHCWYPTGDDTSPFVTMLKFREPDGNVVTIRDIYNQQLTVICPTGVAISEIQCKILYQNRKRDVVIFFYSKRLQWEMSFLN